MDRSIWFRIAAGLLIIFTAIYSVVELVVVDLFTQRNIPEIQVYDQVDFMGASFVCALMLFTFISKIVIIVNVNTKLFCGVAVGLFFLNFLFAGLFGSEPMRSYLSEIFRWLILLAWAAVDIIDLFWVEPKLYD